MKDQRCFPIDNSSNYNKLGITRKSSTNQTQLHKKKMKKYMGKKLKVIEIVRSMGRPLRFSSKSLQTIMFIRESLTTCLARGLTWACVRLARCTTRGWQSLPKECACLGTVQPDKLASLLCTFADARSCEHVTRQDHCLRPPTTNPAAGQRSFAHRAASLFL